MILMKIKFLDKKTKFEFIFFLIIVIFFIFLYFYLPPFGFYSDDEGVKYIQMKSFELNKWKSIEIPYPAKSIDNNFEFLGYERKLIQKDGKLICTYPPLFTFLSSLVSPYLGDRVIYFLPLLSFFISIIFLKKILNLIMDKNFMYFLLLFTYTFASPVFLYSITFWEHLPAVFLTMISLYYITLYFYKGNNNRNIFLSFLFLTGAIFFRTEVIILSISYGLSFIYFSFIQKKFYEIKIVIIGILIPLLFYSLSSLILYNTPLGLHVRFHLPYKMSHITQVLIFIIFFLITVFFFLYFYKKKENQKFIRSFFPLIWIGYFLLIFNKSVVFPLFIYFPIILFLLVDFSEIEKDQIVKENSKEKILTNIILSTFILFISLMALLFYNNPDLSVRYVLTIIPFVFVFLGIKSNIITSNKSIYFCMIIIILLCLLSTGYTLKSNILKFKYFNHDRVNFVNCNTKDGDIIIFSFNSLIEHIGPLYFKRKILVVSNFDKFKQLLKRFQINNINKWYVFTDKYDTLFFEEEMDIYKSQYKIKKKGNFYKYLLYEIKK